jgi:RNA 3'-terminal phosphate cyclase (ATP)
VSDFVTIDGAQGGGQMLRNAVALSAVTGRAVRVVNIRGGRPQPGLRPQHVLGMRAVAEVCQGEVTGAEVGSREVTLRPGAIVSRPDWRLDVGTAGSVTLLLQSLLPALTHAPGESTVTLIGGTDVPFSPPFDYVRETLRPALRRMGVEVDLQLVRRGFYPKGGGEVVVRVRPARIAGFSGEGRTKITVVRGRSYSQGLPEHIAERMRQAALLALGHEGYGKAAIQLAVTESGPSTGCGIALWAETAAGLTLGGNALGERGKPAERVGEEAAKMLLREIRAKGAVDSHLADQLIVWAALAEGSSEYTTSRITDHITSAVQVAEMVAGARFTVEEGPPVRIRCEPAPRQE